MNNHQLFAMTGGYMKRFKVVAALMALAGSAAIAAAQGSGTTQNTPTVVTSSTAITAATGMTAEEKVAAAATIPPILLQNFRPEDQRGLNVFEAPKTDNNVPYQGFKLNWGAAFTQQFQGLDHSNTAVARMV